MSQEVEGVDYFTSDLIRRTRARKKRLEQEIRQSQPSDDQPESDFVFDENLGQIVRKKVTAAGDDNNESVAEAKSPIKQQAPIKSVLSSNRLSHLSASPSIPYIDKSSSESLPAAPVCSPSQSSTGAASASDLPRYKVEIRSRFSPVKKATSRQFSPVVKPQTPVATSLKKLPTASSVPATSEKAASPARKSPKPILEKFKVMREEVEKEATSDSAKPVSDVPVSSIRGRIQHLEQALAQHSAAAEPPAPAPETLSLKHKKVLFEKKIRAEAVQKDAGIKRNEYLAQKRGRSASQMPVVSEGIVAKMQQKIIAAQVPNDSDNEIGSNTYQPSPSQNRTPDSVLDCQKVGEADKSMATNEFDKMNEESALAAFFDIERMDGESADANEMDLDQQNPYLSNARCETSPPLSPLPDEADAMSMCTQSSQSDKEFDSLPSSSSKSSGSCRMYPDLPAEEERETLPSSPKKLRFCDQVVQEAISPPMSSDVTPLRTLSRYRLEQKERRTETPASVPKVVFHRTATTLQSQDRLEADRKSELRRQLNVLKNEEIPRCETRIRQSIQALKACLVSDFRDTLSHADAERHVLVSKMKRASALNHIHFLTSQINMPVTIESIAGHLTIQRLDLPIMRDAVLAHKKGLNTKSPESQFYFCVASCGPVVFSTECLPFTSGYSSGFLSFNLHSGFAFPDLKHDFELRVEVFEVTLMKSTKKESGRAIRLTPRKQHNHAPVTEKDDEQVAVSKGNVMINVKNIKKKDMDLQNFRFESSLQGSIRIGMSVVASYMNDYSNFLNFYDDKVDVGTWKRRWCHVKGPMIRFWRLPEDEESDKKPLGEIDLRHCINPSIGPAPFDVCPRKESFVLVFAGTASDKTRLRVNWLVNKNYKDVIERKLVAADVVEERDEWISVLSQVLSGMRVWDEEALIPCTSNEIHSYIHI